MEPASANTRLCVCVCMCLYIFIIVNESEALSENVYLCYNPLLALTGVDMYFLNCDHYFVYLWSLYRLFMMCTCLIHSHDWFHADHYMVRFALLWSLYFLSPIELYAAERSVIFATTERGQNRWSRSKRRTTKWEGYYASWYIIAMYILYHCMSWRLVNFKIIPLFVKMSVLLKIIFITCLVFLTNFGPHPLINRYLQCI